MYIVDRWKDMYVSGGENVFLAEVENVLYQLPEVAEAAVIDVPNDIAIVDALPRNATGRVLERELRTQFLGADAPLIS